MYNRFFISQKIDRRIFLVKCGKISLLSFLISRFFYLQIVKNKTYTLLSKKNCIQTLLIPAIRGEIIDINGIKLATNKKCFIAILKKSKNANDVIEKFCKILDLSSEIKNSLILKINKFQKEIILLSTLTWEQIVLIEENSNILQGIIITVQHRRYYNYDHILSHVLGYTGANNHKKTISEQENIGKEGIEKYYENDLKGIWGFKEVEINAYGHHVREIKSINSVEGQKLVLNIDINLQSLIYEMLDPLHATAIVMNAKNGNIHSMVSTPSFSANKFITGINHQDWQKILYDPGYPLINKAIQNHYPPGSIFKLVTVLAALESGWDPNTQIYCDGSSFLDKHFKCWKKIGHGKVNLKEAIAGSCNTYIFSIAQKIGASKIIETAAKFGFGEYTNIDLPGEIRGFLPNQQWKKKHTGMKWLLGDTLNMSIGQGFTLSSPIQLARFVTAIASKGKLFSPKIAKYHDNPEYQGVKTNNLKFIQDIMWNIINTQGGTGYLKCNQYSNSKIAGKTSTSQIKSYNKNQKIWNEKSHAIFVGYAPFEDPEYTVTVLVEHAGWGGKVAAPIGCKILNLLMNYNKL